MTVTKNAASLSALRAARRLMPRSLFSLATIVLVVVAGAIPAQASLLSEWNLLVETNVTTGSHVDGSTKVGGNMTASGGVFTMHEVTAGNGDGLAVGGNASGDFQINNGGNLRLGGTNSASVTYNGGGHFIADPGVAAEVTADFAYLDTLSGLYAALTPNGTLSIPSGSMTASPTLIDGQLVAVYNIAAGDLTGLGSLNLNIGSADSVIINVTGASVSFVAPPNIGGSFSQANSTRILWNLPTATQVTVNNSFSGALLAPYADLKVLGGGMNGTVAVHSISQQIAEIRNFTYTGFVPVPEPASVVLFFIGAAVLAWLRLRRGPRR